MSAPRADRRSGWARFRGVAQLLVVLYAASAVLWGFTVVTGAAGPTFTTGPAPAPNSFVDDPAQSWNRLNEGTAEQQPSWDVDDFLAVAGRVRAGTVTALAGVQPDLDAAAVTAAIGGRPYAVVVTPRTPLGAVETTRVRDNTVQQAWGNPRGLTLLMVHGTEVYVGGPKTYIGQSAASGIPLREAMRTGDATPVVLDVVAALADATAPDRGDAEVTAQQLDAGTTAAPTASALAAVTADLDRGAVHVDSSLRGAALPELPATLDGRPLKVAVLPFAARGSTPVDWAGALARRYPDAAVVVLTGTWVTSAGLDRDRVLAAAMQTYGLGGFALAAGQQAPLVGPVLQWVVSGYQLATAAAAAHPGLPALPSQAAPDWVGWTAIGGGVAIALVLVGAHLLRLRRPRPTRARTAQHDTAGTGFAAAVAALDGCSVQLSGLPGAKAGLPAHWLARASAELAGLRDIAADTSLRPGAREQAALERSWSALDAAAGALGFPTSGPSATLDPALRPPPPGTTRPASARPAAPRATVARAGRARWWQPFVIPAFLGVIIAIVAGAMVLVPRAGSGADADVSGLRTSNVEVQGSVPGMDAGTVQQLREEIGTRALLLVVTDDDPHRISSGDEAPDAYDLARSAAARYPDAMVFVVARGEVATAEIGATARTAGYDGTSAISDYSGPTGTADGNPVLLTGQLVLLYDRLVALGQVHGADRTSYDPPAPPWGWIAAALVVGLLLLALAVRLVVRRELRRDDARDELSAEREQLRTRLGGLAAALFDARAPADRIAAFQQRQADLLERIGHADAGALRALEGEVDALEREVLAPQR